MTKDTSPENLRKFLESDDPGLRRMGLSLAIGSGITEKSFKHIFVMSMLDSEEEIREMAATILGNIGDNPEFLEILQTLYLGLVFFGVEEAFRMLEGEEFDLQSIQKAAEYPETWISASEIKNFMNQEPILDWIELYGKEKGFSNRAAIDYGPDFKQEVIRTLKLKFGRGNFVQVATDSEDRRISKVGETLHRMKSGVPLILQGFLWNPDNKTYGMPDIMVRSDMLPKIPENEEYQSFYNLERSSGLGNYHYRIIDVKFTTFNYNADGDYLLGADAYKAQSAICNQALGKMQRYMPPEAYLLGRNWKRTKNGVEIRGEGAFDRLGVVDLFNVDREFIQKANDAIDWRRKVRKEGSIWSFSDAVELQAVEAPHYVREIIFGRRQARQRKLKKDTIKFILRSLNLDTKEKENLMKFLRSDDQGIFKMGTSMLNDVRALEIGGTRDVELLIGVLLDENSDARKSASEELNKLGWVPETDRQRAAYLIAVEDWQSLVEWGVPAIEPLTKMLSDKDEWIRKCIVETLGEIGNARAVEPLIKALKDDNLLVREAAVVALDALGWEPDTEQFQLERLLAPSDLRFSDVPIEAQEGLVEHGKLLEKILNLEQEEFAKILMERSKLLETMEDPCTAEELIELLTGASSRIRWIVACGVVEISCVANATIDKMFENPINLFWSRISAYSNPITKANRDEMVRVLKRLPPVLAVYICGNLYNFAIASFKDKAFKDKKADVMKKNRKMIITIFEDPSLAKDVLGKMR